jgi:hypothetical protein
VWVVCVFLLHDESGVGWMSVSELQAWCSKKVVVLRIIESETLKYPRDLWTDVVAYDDVDCGPSIWTIIEIPVYP